ncbi:MAG: YlmC/YmxH family sporulation protein [Eubacteriaceae bacterium]|nr:YlmC/YmxH family sporulation protein [Eubacteriaceae bacterium]
MMFFSMRNKAIVNYSTGERIGYLGSCDLKIKEDEGLIEAIMMPKSRFASLFGHDENDYIEIPWSNIKKIGIDTIIVEI